MPCRKVIRKSSLATFKCVKYAPCALPFRTDCPVLRVVQSRRCSQWLCWGRQTTDNHTTPAPSRSATSPPPPPPSSSSPGAKVGTILVGGQVGFGHITNGNGTLKNGTGFGFRIENDTYEAVLPAWAAVLFGFIILLVLVNLALIAWKYKDQIREFFASGRGKKMLDRLKKKASRYSPEVVFDGDTVKVRVTGDQLRNAVREATAAFLDDRNENDCDPGDGIRSDPAADELRETMLDMDVDADEIVVLQEELVVEEDKEIPADVVVHREEEVESEPVPRPDTPRIVVQSPAEVEVDLEKVGGKRKRRRTGRRRARPRLGSESPSTDEPESPKRWPSKRLPHVQKWIAEVHSAQEAENDQAEGDDGKSRARSSRWGQARPLDLKVTTFEKMDSGDTLSDAFDKAMKDGIKRADEKISWLKKLRPR